MFKNLKLFAAGGSAYVLLEYLWRGRSHWTMFCLAGGCFLAIGRLRQPMPLRMLSGSAICTAGELATGLVFNRDYSVWDYRAIPFNYRGQICLPFSMLWVPVSLIAAMLYDTLDRRI